MRVCVCAKFNVLLVCLVGSVWYCDHLVGIEGESALFSLVCNVVGCPLVWLVKRNIRFIGNWR